MEKKIQYSLNLLSMLFLAFAVVSAKLDNPNNLYSVVYVGDTNVTVGKPFWIQCLAEGPIEWHKDNQPIQQLHFIRHSKDDYGYVQKDEPYENDRFFKSTIKVKHALMMHAGKYKCSSKHEKSHVLHVHDADSVIVELDSDNVSLEDEYDDDIRRVSFEPPIIGDDALKSTMMMYVEEVSESSRLFSSNFDESYEKIRVDSIEKVSDKVYEFEDVEMTTQSMVTTIPTTGAITTTTTHIPQHEITHKHNKHKIHEPKLFNEHENPLNNPHDPIHHQKDNVHKSQSTKHQKHENHALPTQQSHSVSVHEVDPTILLTTEHMTTTMKHHREGAQLEAVYENGQQFKLYSIGKPLSLACKAADPTKITWKRNNKNVNDVDSLKGRYQILEKEGRFLIERSHLEDAGNYSCHLDSESKEFLVSAKILVKIPENIYVVEEDKLEITCIVKGTNADISWHYSNGTDTLIEITSANERIKIEDKRDEETDNVESSKLTIDHVLLSDKGTYYCNGTNSVMINAGVDPASSDGLVRIKGKLAALWPFLGICAEVFILCAIILIYEKRRNKTDLDESDTDQSPDQKNDYQKDSDVRHRK